MLGVDAQCRCSASMLVAFHLDRSVLSVHSFRLSSRLPRPLQILSVCLSKSILEAVEARCHHLPDLAPAHALNLVPTSVGVHRFTALSRQVVHRPFDWIQIMAHKVFETSVYLSHHRHSGVPFDRYSIAWQEKFSLSASPGRWIPNCERPVLNRPAFRTHHLVRSV